MPSFYQVFGDGPICIHAYSYCEYEGDVEPVCNLVKSGYLFCHKCDKYEPKVEEEDA